MPIPHPVKGVLANRRVTIRRVSDAVGINEKSLSRCFNGYIEPWPALRRKVAAFLDVPEASLFRSSSDLESVG